MPPFLVEERRAVGNQVLEIPHLRAIDRGVIDLRKHTVKSVNQIRLEIAYAVPNPSLSGYVHRGSMPGHPNAARSPRHLAMCWSYRTADGVLRARGEDSESIRSSAIRGGDVPSLSRTYAPSAVHTRNLLSTSRPRSVAHVRSLKPHSRRAWAGVSFKPGISRYSPQIRRSI